MTCVVFKFEDRLAVSSNIDLIIRILQYIYFVFVGEDTDWWFAAKALLRDVSVAQIAGRKLSRREGKWICRREFVDTGTGLDWFLLFTLMIQSMDDFIMQNIETHCCQSHSRHYVTGTEPYGYVLRLVNVIVRIGTGYHVAKPDCA